MATRHMLNFVTKRTLSEEEKNGKTCLLLFATHWRGNKLGNIYRIF